MNKQASRLAAGLCSLAAILSLAACGDRVENTEMPLPQQANVEINRQGMDGAKEEKQAVGVEHNTNAMVAGKQQAAAEDPDTRIAADVQAALKADPDFTAMKIDVHADDGKVILMGRAPDPAARERANDIVRTVRDVKEVDNRLTLG
ncbi:MAG TPA: BON domain-containing protein [Ramlibacter sp.]|jgi:osmotically-inducible protein OsmY|nr:BON domain-containing protein [Ramlibacter sp.]